jgi:excisionase family DNA binding protein
MNNNLLTAKQVHKLLNVSQALVYKMSERGQLPSIRWEAPGNGRKKEMVRFKLEDILQFIEAHRK